MKDTQIHIRSLGAGEEQAIRELLLSLDPVSWYFRFLSPYPTGLDGLVRLLAPENDESRVSFVAERRVHGSMQLIGMGNIAVNDSGDAELGVVVRCHWQRQHVGTALAIQALAAAERRGVSRFVCHIVSRNIQGRRLLARIGVVRSVHFAGRLSEYWFTPRSLRDRHEAPDRLSDLREASTIQVDASRRPQWTGEKAP